jgi:hypothetical protein
VSKSKRVNDGLLLVGISFLVGFGIILLCVAYGWTAEPTAICVPKGFEWLANTEVGFAGYLQHPETGEIIAKTHGEHEGTVFVALINAETGEIVWFDPDPKNSDAPGYESGPKCTWRLVHEQKGFYGPFEEGVLVARKTNL